MKRSIQKTGIFAAAAMTALLLSGCVTTAELNEVRAIAEEALQKAEQANSCCVDTNEKIDRMFKKSMYK